MAARQVANQPTYDFLAADEPLRESTFRVSKQPNLRQDSSHDASLIELNAIKYELATIKEERERDKLQQQQELRDLHQRLQEEGKTREQEKTEKNYLFERQKTLTEELATAKEEALKQKESAERNIRNLQSQYSTANEEVSELQNEIESIQRRHAYQCNELKSASDRAQQALKELQWTFDTQSASLQQLQQKLLKRDEEFTNLQGQVLKNKSESDDKDTLQILKREMSEQVHHIQTLESTLRKQTAELTHLREYSKSYSILEEQHRNLQSRFSVVDNLREQISNAEVQIAILKEEKLSWAAFLQSDENDLHFDSPEHLVRALVQERIEKASLVEQFGRTGMREAEQNDLITELEQINSTLKSKVSQLEEDFKTDQKAKQRLERQKALASKEASFLREQLRTYVSEETMINSTDNEDQKARRIEELEGLLEEHKREIASLISQVREIEETVQAAPNQATKRALDVSSHEHEEALGQMSRKLRSLQDELHKASADHALAIAEVKSLQKRLSAAETTSQLRVLQLKDNPTERHEIVKRETLDALKRENADLLAQLEGRPGGAKLVPMSTLENSRMDVKEMEKVVAEKEKRMMRLKEMWGKKALEFRQAVYSILGYEVDFQPNGRVKVTSMFHSSDFYGGVDTGIIFDGEQGTMKLCGGQNSQFAREAKNQLKFYVEERKEIPCFLAALTLEGYEKTTRANR